MVAFFFQLGLKRFQAIIKFPQFSQPLQLLIGLQQYRTQHTHRRHPTGGSSFLSFSLNCPNISKNTTGDCRILYDLGITWPLTLDFDDPPWISPRCCYEGLMRASWESHSSLERDLLLPDPHERGSFARLSKEIHFFCESLTRDPMIVS